MKNELIATLFCIFILQSVNAQFDWGIKGGLNFASANDIKLFAKDLDFKTDNNTGYHTGLFLKVKATRFYIRPELVYTVTKSSYELSTFKQGKIDLPILFGLIIVKPISLFAGPSFQYVVNSDFDLFALGDFEKELTSIKYIGLCVLSVIE